MESAEERRQEEAKRKRGPDDDGDLERTRENEKAAAEAAEALRRSTRKKSPPWKKLLEPVNRLIAPKHKRKSLLGQGKSFAFDKEDRQTEDQILFTSGTIAARSLEDGENLPHSLRMAAAASPPDLRLSRFDPSRTRRF